jgi:hypothetical protein
MAWRFKILSVQTAERDVTVRVSYFDDLSPAQILGRATLRLSADTSRADARTAIIAEGRLLRAGIEARSRLAQDVGQEGAVT